MRFEATEYLSLHSPALEHCDFVPQTKPSHSPQWDSRHLQQCAALVVPATAACDSPGEAGLEEKGKTVLPAWLDGTCNPFLPLPGLLAALLLP